MAQVKVYGLKDHLQKVQDLLSTTIHTTIVEVLSFPQEKRFHRFIGFEKEQMLFPEEKSSAYMIIEIYMMEGRTVETKKQLIKTLFSNISQTLEMDVDDIEILIIESPASNWGFRGMTGDEIRLDYRVDI